MGRTADEIYREALKLSDEEWEKLLALLDAHADSGASRADIERELSKEAARQYEAYKRGKVEAIPVAEVFRRLNERLKK